MLASSRVREKKLQIRKELSSGNNPGNFALFANDVNENVPRTFETELDAGFYSTRSR
jgi:hypothetical protein